MKLGASTKKRKEVPLNIVAQDSSPVVFTVHDTPVEGLGPPQDSVSTTAWPTGWPEDWDGLGAFVAQSQASLHISYRDGRFLVVGHRAKDHKCMDVTTPDLSAGLRMFVEEMSK